jgi:hypothetical protein
MDAVARPVRRTSGPPLQELGVRGGMEQGTIYQKRQMHKQFVLTVRHAFFGFQETAQ